MSSPPLERRRAAEIVSGLGVLVVGVLLLVLQAGRFHLDQLHVEDLNDQVGYITTARRWVDTGHLTSHLVYPAYVEQESFRFYMPGHYAVLALAYVVGGDHPLVWRLPGMASFLLVGLGAYVAARKLHGSRLAGWVAALCFFGLPASVGLSFTAMSEPTTAAACMTVVVAFLFLPARIRPWALPFLVAVPFLFRETTGLLVLPLGALVAWGGERPRLRAAFFAAAASLALCIGLYAWQVAEGKWTPPPGSWSGNDPGYASITAVALESEIPPLGERLHAIGSNVVRNALDVARNTRRVFSRLWAPSNVIFVLALHLLALGGGLCRRPREPFSAGAAGAGVMALLVFLGFHHAGTAHVLLRQLFWTHPLACVAVGGLGASAAFAVARRIPHPSLRILPAAVLLALLAIVHAKGVKNIARRVALAEKPLWTTRLEGIGHDEGTLLVCSAGIGLDYVLKHYPVRWAFLPSDEATLRALERRYEVGTIVEMRARLRQGLGGTALRNLGYEEVDRIEDRLGTYLVFRKKKED